MNVSVEVRMRLTFLSFFLPCLLHAQEKISYDDHVFPILEQNCLNCHNPDKAKGGLDLSSYSATIKGGSSGKIVEPGDTSSTIVNLVKHSAEPKMPPEGDKLSSPQIETISKWIADGLLENKASKARKPSKPKFETSLRSDPSAKPDGPPPMPEHLLLEPPVVTSRPSTVHAMATSPWAPLLAVTAQKQVLLYHTQTLELLGILPFPEGDPISLNFTPSARYLIVGGGTPGKSGITVTFDITNGSRSLTAAKEFDSILASDIRPSFDIVATGGPSKLLNLWDTQSGERIQSIIKHTDWITALDISPDGILLASGDRNGGVWVWEADSANEFHTLRAHQAAITNLSFRSDSNILASSSEDGSVRFWEMNNGTEIQKIDAHPGGITAFAFSKNGSFITAGRDLHTVFWDPSFKQIHKLKLPALPTAAAIDYENNIAFVADTLGSVHSFKIEKDPKLTTFLTNPPAIDTRLQEIATNIKSKLKIVESSDSEAAAKTTAQSELESLRLAEKSWSAALINAEAIRTNAEATQLASEAESSIDSFLQSLSEIDKQAAALSAKREQYESFASKITNLSASHLEEAQATLNSLQASIKNHQDHLYELETQTTRLNQQSDSSLANSARAKSKYTSLQKKYLQARP